MFSFFFAVRIPAAMCPQIINSTFKDRKDKALTVLVSLVLNQLFSSHVKCLISAKLREVCFKVQ